jgi:hypothetical protein
MNLSQANILVKQALNAYQSKRFAEAAELWAMAGKTCVAEGQRIGGAIAVGSMCRCGGAA